MVAAIVAIKAMGIDDPINAAALHTSNGIWGLIACGFFDNTKGVFSSNEDAMGLFFGYQICGVVAIGAWVFFWNFVFFSIMK